MGKPPLCAFLTSLLMVAARGQTPTTVDLDGWRVRLDTSAVEVVGVQSRDAVTTFLLRNVSSKPIVSFEMQEAKDPHTSLHWATDYFDQDKSVAPGAVDSFKISRADLDSHKTVEVSAVVFADETGDGLPNSVAGIQAKHLGTAYGVEYVKRAFDAVPSTTPPLEIFDAVSANLGEPPHNPEAAIAAMRGVDLPGPRPDSLAGDRARFEFSSGVGSVWHAALHVVQLEQAQAQERAAKLPPTDTRSAVTAARFQELRSEYDERSRRMHARLGGVQ
jgi:hypothetical protein